MSANGCLPFTPFALSVTDAGDEMVVAAHGELDLASADELIREVRRLWSVGAESVVIDLAPLGFMDCSGLRALLELRQAAARKRVGFALTAGPAVVERIFDLTGTRALFRWR